MHARRRLLGQLGLLAAGGFAGSAQAGSVQDGPDRKESAHVADQAQAVPGWQLAEDSAEAYERYLVPVIFTAMANRLLDLAELRAGERVLDVGCGTGIVARSAAPRVGSAGKLVGLDLNEGMLRVARRVSHGSRPPIEWRTGNAESLPFPDQAFDLVVCQQAFQFFSQPQKALAEMRRVLAPGGRAALAVLRPIQFTPAYVPLAEALERHAGPQAGAMMRSPFPPWDREQLRSRIAQGGLGAVRVRIEAGSERYPSPAEMLRMEAASSPLAGALAALSPEAHRGLVAELEATLDVYRDDDGITFPMETFMVLARG